MTGIEIISFLTENLSPVASVIGAVAGGLFTAIFLRHNTAVKEFEKIKAGQFKEVADELLESGQMTHTEYYKANNFLNVAKKADKYYAKMPHKESFDSYDFDWFIRFYEAVGNISNEEMQDLWAKILAGEICHPSSFSLRTIDVLKNMCKEDAALFEKVCKCSICSKGTYFLPRYENYLERKNISYAEIMQLSELGLMYNDGTIVLKYQPKEGKNICVFHRDLLMLYNYTSEHQRQFNINQYPFTQVGNEIASIKGYCASDEDFLFFAREVRSFIPDISFQVHTVLNWSDDQIQYNPTDLLSAGLPDVINNSQDD